MYPEIDFEAWKHIGIVIAVLLITWKFGTLFFRYVARGVVRDFVLSKNTWLHKMYDRKSWLTYPILNSWIGHPLSEVIEVFGAYDKATDWKEGDVRRGYILIWTRVLDDKKIETHMFEEHGSVYACHLFTRQSQMKG